jgi:hypothetical protein
MGTESASAIFLLEAQCCFPLPDNCCELLGGNLFLGHMPKLFFKRFNFGFKFICEDEADRFFKVVGKYTPYHNPSADYVNASPCNVKPSSQMNDLLLLTADTGNASTPVGNHVADAATGPPTQQRQSRKSNSVTRTDSIISSLTSLNSSTIKPSLAAHTTPKTPRSSHVPRPRTPSILTSFKHRAFSSDRKKKIEKIDISCPFRCSTNDLHLTGTDTDHRNQSASLSQVIHGMLS